jgi:predicted component of type VI protein secretion system
MSLELTVKISGSAADRTLTFAESPVRIGRNELNDIAIDDPFISQWHGLIRFGSEGITYADLGSTNGSIIEGRRLSKNAQLPLTDTSRILLGRVELAVFMVAQGKEQTGPGRTMAWGHPSRHDRPSAEAASRQAAASQGQADPARSRSDAPGASAAALERQRQLLEAFSEAFVGLRKGYEQFGLEVGVRTVNGTTALHRARTAKAVLDHLLQPDAPIASVKRDLIAIFADFGIHHIAMMAAVSEGVRAMLQSLDPRANGVDPGGRLFSGSKSKAQWGAYLERFDQLLTDDQDLHASIFGPEFARAYAHATVGSSSKRDRPDDE